MNLDNMTAKELLALVAQAAGNTTTQEAPKPVTAEPETNNELEEMRAENARLKAIASFGITEEVYNEQSQFLNFDKLTPEQYSGMFGQAQPSVEEPKVDPVSKYASTQNPKAPALNENEQLDVAIAEMLGLTK